MKKGFWALTTVCILMLFVSFAAEAATIRITNNSGQDIHELNISSSETQDWGQDLLGQYYIPNGDVYDVNTWNYNQFDLQVVFSNGSYAYWREIHGNVVRFFVYPNRQAEWEWD